MTLRPSAVALAAIALLALPMPATAAKRSKPVVREFKGTVVSVAAKGKTFRLRRIGRAAVLVTVSRKTKVAKGAKPRKGRKLVVKARRSKKGWQARSVRLVPVLADDDQLTEDDSLDEPDVDDEGDELEPDLDLEDVFGDLLGDEDDDGGDSGEEPEE